LKRHIVEIQMDHQKIIWQSSELASLLQYLRQENKLLGLITIDNNLKIVNYNDFFDVNLFEVLSNNTTIIIDRNLLIAARNIYNHGYSSDEVDRFFLQILSYAMFTDSIIDPSISLYEGGNNSSVSAIEDLRKFRIVDNLPLDTVLQLLFGEIDKIPTSIFNEATRITKSIDDRSLKEDYNKQLTLFKRNYPYFLKTAILLRKKSFSKIEKLEQFFKWVQNHYISMNIPFLIVKYSLLKGGGILKKVQDNNKEKLLYSIQNATWDATMLSYLKDQSRKNNGRYYLMATNDVKLVDVMRYCFSPDDEIEKLYGRDINKIKGLVARNNELCDQKERNELVTERLNNLNNIIEQLEREL
jgi:hypothetical protein